LTESTVPYSGENPLLYLIRPLLWTAVSLALGSGMVAAVGLSSPGTSSYSGAASQEGPALAPALTPGSPLPGRRRTVPRAPRDHRSRRAAIRCPRRSKRPSWPGHTRRHARCIATRTGMNRARTTSGTRWHNRSVRATASTPAAAARRVLNDAARRERCASTGASPRTVEVVAALGDLR
jgi:hypothetical protein